jgi:hypothetical protein
VANNDFRSELEAAFPDSITARDLAAAALERNPQLLDYYPSGFLESLSGQPLADEATASVGEWIAASEQRTRGGIRDSGELYLCLVLASDDVAGMFRSVRPEAAGFERICKGFTDRISHEDKERWDDLVGTSPTLDDRRRLPAMAQAVDSNEAEFSLLSEARAYQRSKFLDRPAANRTYARFYPPLRRAFEAKHGRIVEEYWCENIALGVVRTFGRKNGGRLHFDGDYDETISEIINRCKEVHRKGQEYLPSPEYENLVSELYGLLTDLFAIVDRAAGLVSVGSSGLELDQEGFLKKVAEIETSVEKGMARRGQRWYISGTVIGLGALSLLLGFLALLSSGQVQRIFEGAIFGAAGAIASVLYRMNQGELRVDAQQGPLLVYVAAMVRPLTGALFGGIISALLLSGLIPIEIPKDDADRFYFLGVLGFVAGLSERWAPDLLQLTAEQVSGQAFPKDGEKG